jgi:hypothetical protein
LGCLDPLGWSAWQRWGAAAPERLVWPVFSSGVPRLPHLSPAEFTLFAGF